LRVIQNKKGSSATPVPSFTIQFTNHLEESWPSLAVMQADVQQLPSATWVCKMGTLWVHVSAFLPKWLHVPGHSRQHVDCSILHSDACLPASNCGQIQWTPILQSSHCMVSDPCIIHEIWRGICNIYIYYIYIYLHVYFWCFYHFGFVISGQTLLCLAEPPGNKWKKAWDQPKSVSKTPAVKCDQIAKIKPSALKSLCVTPFNVDLVVRIACGKPYRDYRNSPNSPEMDLYFKEAELCPPTHSKWVCQNVECVMEKQLIHCSMTKVYTRSHEASQRTFLPCPPCQTHVKSSFAWIHGNLDCVESRTWQAKSIYEIYQ
jgi:hypothetical protein